MAASVIGRRRLIAAAAYTAAINGLALTGPAYTFLIFDRVLPSGSYGRLFAASAIMLGLYALSAGVDFARQSLLANQASHTDRWLRAMAARRLASLPAREIDDVRAMLCGPAASAMCDLPWTPLCFGMLALLHPLFAALAIAGCVAIAGGVLLVEKIAGASETAGGHAGGRNAAAMVPRAPRRAWLVASAQRRADHEATARKSTLMTVMLRAMRPLLQSATLGLGAYLVMEGACHAPSILAATILLARLVGPVETIAAHWRTIGAAWASVVRLTSLFDAAAAHGGGETSRARRRPAPGEIRIILRRSDSYARNATRGVARSASSGLRPTAQ
ncbi:MAG: hypothetical protein WC829_10845 [Hyphomicrobium sp.]